MPGSTIGRGNILVSMLLGPTLTPTSVAAATTSEQNFAVLGLQPTDFINISFNGSQTAGMAVENARCATAGVLTIAFSNDTAGTLTPASGVYIIGVDRAENLPLPTNAL